MYVKMFILCLTLLSLNDSAFAKSPSKNKKKSKARTAKLSKEDAKELCLINKGASIPDEEIEKCTVKTIKAGKFVD